MTRKALIQALLPHAAALAIFITLSSAYFSPVWKGYELRQGDIDHWRGMSKEVMDYRMLYGDEALWTNSMFGGMPAYQISTLHGSNLMRPVIVALRLGLPGPVGVLFLAMLGFYIFALCLRINPWLGIAGAIAFGFSTINILYLGAGHAAKVNAIAFMPPVLGGLILAFRGKAFTGAVIFMLFLALHITANHLQMTYYLAILCGLVAVSESARLLIQKQTGVWLRAAGMLTLAAILAVLPSMSNLLTTAEYSKFTTRGKSELTITPDGDLKSGSELTGLETTYILDYNFASGEQWSLFIPNAKGGQSAPIGNNKELLRKVSRDYREDIARQNQYWGAQRFTGGAFYFGAITMLLFVLGLIFCSDSLRWPFLLLALVALALSSKEYSGLNAFFIDSFPLYNKFRDSKMILVTVQLMAPAMALLFIQQLIKKQLWTMDRRIILGAAGTLVAITLLLVARPTVTGPLLSTEEVEMFDNYAIQFKGDSRQLAMVDDYRQSLEIVRTEIFRSDAIRSLLFMLFGLGICVLVFFRVIREWAAGIALAGLIAIDLWGIDQRYLSDSKVKSEYIAYVKADDKLIPYKPAPADLMILEEESTHADYASLKSDLHKAMKESPTFGRVRNKDLVEQVASFGALNLTSNYRVLNLGNTFNDAATSYYHKSIGGYHGAKLKNYQEVIDFHLGQEIRSVIDSLKNRNPIGGLAQANALNMLNTRYVVYNPDAPPIANPFALGNAWFVKEIIVAPTANEEILQIAEIDPSVQAVAQADVAQLLTAVPTIDSLQQVVLEEYSPRLQRYRSVSSVPGVIVFSEIYYPAGWVCRIDDVIIPHHRVNYILRAIPVEAGEHVIEWSFEPAVWQSSNRISMAGSLILILLVFVTGFREIRSRLRPENSPQ